MNGIAIIVDYDPFAMESYVYVMQDNNRDTYKVASSIPELAETLVKMAQEHKIYSVKIRGPYAIMHEIKRAVAENEMKTYETNKIIVEGL